MSLAKVKSYHHFLLGAMLACHTGLLAVGGWWMSPTLDEPAHLVAGLSHWQRGDFSLYRVNPPLVRLIATVPMLIAGQDFELPERLNGVTDRKEFWLGEKFVTANGRWSLWLTTLGRWACIPLSLLGAVTCYWWARDLYGPAAGLMSCGLWCFSPLVLGHAALLTPDAHAAALGALACYTFWLWLKQPTWRRTLVAGLILGLAELSKTTLILFYPLWPVMWLLYRWKDRAELSWRDWRNQGLMLASRLLIGLCVVNLGYLGAGSFVPLKEYHFRSQLFGDVQESRTIGNRFHDTWLEQIPVPLPYDYVLGIDHQQRDFERFWGPSYLRGQYQERGWWYYYVYALAVKAPLGTLFLLLLTVGMSASRWMRWRGGRDEWVLLAPMLFVFVVVSSKYGFSHHLRYIFPCLPLAFVWMGQLMERSQWLSEGWSTRLRSLAVAGCLVWTTVSSLWHFPHSLAYFNELAGGPQGGARHLLNSNIDWGQDLLHLERWIERQASDQTVYLAFDNYYNPFVLEIAQIEPWPLRKVETPADSSPEVPDGLYAISVNQLYEFPWALRDNQGQHYHVDLRPLKNLRSMQPVARAGYSIRIYSAEQVREAYQSAELE